MPTTTTATMMPPMMLPAVPPWLNALPVPGDATMASTGLTVP